MEENTMECEVTDSLIPSEGIRDGLNPSTPAEQKVVDMLKAGYLYKDISSNLNIAKSTISYYAKKNGLLRQKDAGKRYDWYEIQAFYDKGNSIRSVNAEFGTNNQAISQAKSNGKFVTRPKHFDIFDYLHEGSKASRSFIKARLIASGLLIEECNVCHITEWLGTPLSLHLHHINGVNNDNRLENLELLCPNCHSLTDNYGGKGRNIVERQ